MVGAKPPVRCVCPHEVAWEMDVSCIGWSTFN